MAVVKMRVSIVGPDVWVQAGDLFPCDAATARRLVESGQADAAEPEAPETMSLDMRGVEHAVTPKPRPRGRGASV